MTETAVNDTVATKADLTVLESRMESDNQALRDDNQALRDKMDSDNQALRDKMDSDNQALREGNRADLAQAETRIIKWLVGSLLIVAGLVIAALKL